MFHVRCLYIFHFLFYVSFFLSFFLSFSRRTETDFVQLNFSFENVVGQLEAKEQEVSSLTNHVEQLKRVIEDERRRRCEGETRANRAEIATLEANNSIEVRKELEKRVEELEIELRKVPGRKIRSKLKLIFYFLVFLANCSARRREKRELGKVDVYSYNFKRI